MMNAYLYCDKRSLNEATLYYVSLVEECLRTCNYDIKRVYRLNDITDPDLIFTITSVSYAKAKLRYPFVKTLSWRQGLGFQEARMTRPWWKWIPYTVVEYITIKTAGLLLFVSERMNEYYRNSFGYKCDNYVIMPCYNLRLSDKFGLSKYKDPTFVYAGGISKWQSVDVILDTYALVEKKISNAKLYLYCKNTDALQRLIKERNIQNVEIKFVPKEQLQDELLQYKYGFILREKNWTNEVATPTKMNSYLAAYLIPVYSDGVDDFKRNIRLGEFQLMTETPLDAQKTADMIVKFEKTKHDYESYKKIVEETFERHYNDDKYKAHIIEAIRNYIAK